MVSLLFAVILSALTSEQRSQQNYAAAYQRSVVENKPLMVVVGAPWCPACNVLKDVTLEPMKSSGELDDVSLVMINRDEAPELAAQVTKGVRTLPQIIVYSQEETGQWTRHRLMGYQSPQPVRSLIRRVLGRS